MKITMLMLKKVYLKNQILEAITIRLGMIHLQMMKQKKNLVKNTMKKIIKKLQLQNLL